MKAQTIDETRVGPGNDHDEDRRGIELHNPG